MKIWSGHAKKKSIAVVGEAGLASGAFAVGFVW
jgi:hypothetical protein